MLMEQGKFPLYAYWLADDFYFTNLRKGKDSGSQLESVKRLANLASTDYSAQSPSFDGSSSIKRC
ncbi:hypothetical protein MPB2EB_1617 [Mycoavidus sp. B2-EB]|nr:hypothetical protein MPB2EB_1617 [Mycoavidus sp. B2-EB]